MSVPGIISVDFLIAGIAVFSFLVLLAVVAFVRSVLAGSEAPTPQPSKENGGLLVPHSGENSGSGSANDLPYIPATSIEN